MKRTLAAPLAAATLLVATLTGCSTGSTDAASADAAAEPTATTTADADAFPVTIEHALGETTIESEPTRVATLGWTDADQAISLGVVPVGATRITWGGNEAGSTAWFDAAVEEVTGFTRYRIEGDPKSPNATVHVVDRGGVTVGMVSRTDSDPRLTGTKHRVAENREVTAVKGRRDGRTIVTGKPVSR